MPRRSGRGTRLRVASVTRPRVPSAPDEELLQVDEAAAGRRPARPSGGAESPAGAARAASPKIVSSR